MTGPGGDPSGARPVGVWLGLDVGAVRIGVARSDPGGLLAVPVETVPADPRTGRDLDRIAALVVEHQAVGVVLGLPRTLAGRDGPAVRAARNFGAALRERIDPVSVRYVDERMTTVLAQRNLTASGVRGRAKRAVVDQAAAVQILQSFLDGAGTIPAPRSDGGMNR
ncbi:MAG TPA: Holliday junction resolvase RuvX [Jatrophihabitans sp.]|nr:Holliday junction resolvase RuvX [Jatrophihabitans sp.]